MNAENTALRRYYTEADFVQHSRDEECDLIARAQAGDIEARNQVVTNNLRFVIKRAGKFINQGVPREDLIMEGNLGLFHAIEKFDLSRGLRFNTYAAWWIDQYIRKALMDQRHTVRVPRHVQQKRPGTPEPNGATILKNGYSLEEEMDYAADEYDSVESIQREELKSILMRFVSKQNPKHRNALILRYGLHGGDSLTLDDIGSQVGLCRERVRQVCDEFMERVRPQLERMGLTGELI